jgi:hypothetical protein
MSIEIKVAAVEELFRKLDLEINTLQTETKLHCNSGCGKCCTKLDKVNGSCSNYPYRGLICRLFGYAATKDKYGQLRLATCKIIKTEQVKNFENASNLIQNGLPVPIFTDYYMNLSQIDYHLGNIILPINKALKYAIEEVLQYYAYRPLPNGFKNIA